jgi:hypothetical protein
MKNTILIFILLIILVFIKFNNKQEYFFDYISNNRKIKIKASEKEQLIIKNIINNYKNEFLKRNVEIEYITPFSLKNGTLLSKKYVIAPTRA